MPGSLKHLRHLAITASAMVAFASALFAQSTDQSFPTPVRTNEITGTIRARDVGDPRLTSHFYTFEGGQGDLFINVQSTNFSGDIDVFVVQGLRPLTKMVLYADASTSETGRVVYLRKPETIILRVEGRSPGDEEATYRIKFAGSFLASRASDESPEVPKVNAETQSNIRVNSVGTIIEVIPKPSPVPKEEPVEPAGKKEDERVADKSPEPKADKDPVEAVADAPPKQEVVISDPLANKENAETPLEAKVPAGRTPRNRRTATKTPPVVKEASETVDEPADKMEEEARADEETKVEPPSKRRGRSKTKRPEPEKAVDPMTGINLVIRFKDGSTIERPMTEVLRFSVERAILTVISKNGTIGRYQMTDIAGVTIE